jgi:DNA-directed RNA polymerase sigma subunit (sigma70/sigma32)
MLDYTEPFYDWSDNRQLRMYTVPVKMTSLDDDDPLKAYLSELGTVQPLTKDEESNLLQHVRSQDAEAESAARRLIEARLSLVVSIAERHPSAGIQMLDLIEKGNLALMLALKTFSESSSDDFATYAAACIERAVSKAIAESQSAGE